MNTYVLNGITVAVILDDRRRNVSGKYPVKIRVTYKRSRKYYSTGKELTTDEWERLPNTKSTELLAVKSDLQLSFDKVKEIVQTIESIDGFTFDALNIRIGKANCDTINTAFKAKIETLNQSGAIGNAIVYTCSLKCLEQYAGQKIPFDVITVGWLKNYEKSMLHEGKSYTTISMYIRCIRVLFNEAITYGTLKKGQYPFGKGLYEIPVGKGRKMALTLPQIKQIITYSDGSEATEHYRDLWFFMYLCNGINVNDMLKLKYGNIDGDEIHFYRSKTLQTTREKKEIEALLTPEMRVIIDKWGNPDKKPDNYVFQFLTGDELPLQQKNRIKDITRRINKHIKKIGDKLGLSGISTYTARHSYATVLKRSRANIAYISESLGHSDLKTTETYLASFEREEREKNAKLLTDFRN